MRGTEVRAEGGQAAGIPRREVKEGAAVCPLAPERQGASDVAGQA